jgi:hypothetical protein
VKEGDGVEEEEKEEEENKDKVEDLGREGRGVVEKE